MQNSLHKDDLDQDQQAEVMLDPVLFRKAETLEGLTVRAINCLRNANLTYIGDLVTKTEADMMNLPAFGRRTLFEIRDHLVVLGLKFGMEIPSWPPENIEELAKNISGTGAEEIAAEPICWPHKENMSLDERLRSLDFSLDLLRKVELLGLSARSAHCLAEANINYIGDLVLRTESDMLKTPNFGRKSLRELNESLAKYGFKFGMEIDGWPPTDVDILSEIFEETLAHEHDENLKEAFTRTLSKVSDPRQLRIFESRLGLNGKPMTLEELGQELGVTRERVRQIQKKLTKQILDREFWDNVLRIKLANLLGGRTSPLYLDSIGAEDAWFEGFEDNLSLLENIICAFSEDNSINFLKTSNRKIICYLSDEVWRDIKYDLMGMLEHSLELNHTMEDIELFIDSKLRQHRAPELAALLFEEISKDFNFSNIGDELVLVSVGNSLTSHLTALLETVESPQHFEDIAKLYEAKYGIPISERYVHSCLVSKDFCLFDRGTYGLKKHLKISPERQNRIRAVIEDEISKHDPNRQWHANDLYQLVSADAEDELNKYAINIILRSSNKLRYLGKSTWKLKVDGDEATERKYIKNAVYDALKQAGKALHVDELEEIVSATRGTSEFFSINLHPNELFSRLDSATWGLLERDFILSPQEWVPIKNKLFEFFTATGHGIHKSELPRALRDITLPPEIEDNHILGVIATDNRFKTWHGGYVGLEGWSDSGRKTFTQVMKEIAEGTQTSITLDEVISNAEGMLGFEFNRGRVSVYLNKYGLAFDRDENLWKKTA